MFQVMKRLQHRAIGQLVPGSRVKLSLFVAQMATAKIIENLRTRHMPVVVLVNCLNHLLMHTNRAGGSGTDPQLAPTYRGWCHRLLSPELKSAINSAIAVWIFRDINWGRKQITKLVILTQLAVFLSNAFSCACFSYCWSSEKHDIISKPYIVQPESCTTFGVLMGLSNFLFNLEDHIFLLFISAFGL